MQIEVIIRNITPIFSASPEGAYIGLDGTFNPSLDKPRFPVTRARTLKVVAEDSNGVARPVHLPVVPGNTMRNLLRRTMLEYVIQPALLDKAAQLSIGAYAAAYSGSATGNPDGVPSSFDETVALRSHPFIGLFGGGPRMLKGRLMVDTLYPIHGNAERIIGSDYINECVSGQITDVVWTRRNDPVLALGDAQDAAVIEGGAQAANNWITNLLATTKAKKAKAGKEGGEEPGEASESKRGLNAFNAHEVVIGGVKWLWRINADQPTKAQVGLILLALSNITNLRIAGGHAKDYGRFVIDGVTLNGQQIWSQNSFSGQDLTPYFDAIAEELDSLSKAEFEQFAASAKEA